MNRDSAGLQLRYEFVRAEEYAAWINVLTFYVSGFFLSKFHEKKNYQKRFLVSEFISNLYLINKIH